MSNIDIEFGKAAEEEVLILIREKWDSTIRRTIGQYNTFDFESDTRKYELKARRVSKDTYPTTFIGSNKIANNATLLFKFTDGVYYYEILKDKFKLDKDAGLITNKLFKREGNYKQNEYTYIATSLLTQLV